MNELRLRAPTLLPIVKFGGADKGFTTARVTSPFGMRGGVFHGGLDIGNGREGDVLVAVAPMTIIAAGYLLEPWSEPTNRYATGNYGGLMAVGRMTGGAIAIYAHLRSLDVLVDDVLDAGDRIGTIGSTGAAAPPPLGGGAHVHFGIQAPRSMVPVGVETRATHFGIGLDVDPWPLITGAAHLLLEEDMDLPAGLSALVVGTLGVGNRLRDDPDTAEGSRIMEEEREVQLLGSGVPGERYVLGGKAGTEYLMVGVYGRAWYVARPLIVSWRLKGDGTALATDCTTLENKLRGAKTAIDGAAQALTAAQRAVA